MDCKKYFGFFDEEHPEPYVIKSGTLPIIISAPHTYRHFREGRVKAAERGAGVIAMALGDMKGTHWMVKAREDGDDPNYSADSPYKKALAAYMTENGVRYLIDLHELAPSRPTDVNPLINGGKNIKGNEDLYGEIKNVFINGGFTVTEDFPYAGKTDNRVTAYVNRKTGLFSLQLELNSRLLYPGGEHCRLDDMLKAFGDIVGVIMRHDMKKDG